MNKLEHGRVQYFLTRVAESGFPSRIHLFEVAIRRDNTSQIRYKVEEPFKVTLRLCRELVDSLALGYVKADTCDSDRLTKIIVCASSRRTDPANLSIGKRDPVFDRQMRRPILEAILNLRDNARSIFRMQGGAERFPVGK